MSRYEPLAVVIKTAIAAVVPTPNASVNTVFGNRK
jgi:hypothetical protein